MLADFVVGNHIASHSNTRKQELQLLQQQLQDEPQQRHQDKPSVIGGQSLYTIWNIVQFLAIGIFVLLALFKRQDLLNSFYNNEDQCCYCLVNAQDESINRRTRPGWSVCEHKFGDNTCYNEFNQRPYKIRDQCNNSLFLYIFVYTHSTFFGNTPSFFFGALRSFFLKIFHNVYYTLICYPALGVYISFYNILASMGSVSMFKKEQTISE
ncbi:hypothetical protein RFI_22720 [Reticulomyxa filosa]|uniref:Uncharacterized protein n=1 Tax=Reticulomyxa filosa TaxID=46433 RepID=X6ML97_RETFI|nr:hypothetical protein RFI_22720 [Reticulomyxa filosa]|eukprot:ETO14649.1 hypothetical protein RFI_22720 [Reticulomyxa filosa]